ncbi:hypothetical protein C0Q70_09202 [Pomacea canaliculata]|uniref:Dynein heavy chain C-terminal domain-containing protein n=1 Tax=Pomacea canaliculata TaxID=400727 RepID=A0A2T7P959_POMCA|nr:hypothetical protein C0Q70_09202 [Pomacea canaliculata]
MQLANATWNPSQEVLSELLPGAEAVEVLPPLWIKPRAAGEEPSERGPQLDVYLCPFFACPDLELQQDSNLVTHVPLPTRVPPATWAQSRVALSCRLSNPQTVS